MSASSSQHQCNTIRHSEPKPYAQIVLSRVPPEIWSIMFATVLSSCSLGQLLLCAGVCAEWRQIILSNPDLEHLLLPFATTLGGIKATPERGKKTPARSLGQNLAKKYGPLCEGCGAKGKLNKVGLWQATNGILCLVCRVALLNKQNHPGRPLTHHRGDTIPCSDLKRMGIPEKYVKGHMQVAATRPNPYLPRGAPINLYRVLDAQRASYAVTQSLEPIHLDSKAFSAFKSSKGRRNWNKHADEEGCMTYEEWEDAYGLGDEE